VSAGYYLNVVRVMFMKPRPQGAAEVERAGNLTRGIVLVTAVAIVVLGLVPSRVIAWSRVSVPQPPQVQAAAADAPR
jgi:NADH:ubiquinone oxidoreductase subunit 2 (subunit N)